MAEPPDPPSSRALVDPGGAERRRDTVLARLREAGRPLSVGEVAGLTGLHANTVRFHLAALVRDGDVERTPDPRGTPGRPKLLYTARAGSPRGPRSYRLLAQMLTDLAGALGGGGTTAVEAGRSWGRRLVHDTEPGAPLGGAEAVARMNRLLDDVGFRPTLHGDPTGAEAEVRLHHCPFREVAADAPDVVCALHLGLMQGALAELGAPLRAASLHPWVTPDLCVARLAAAEPEPEDTAHRGGGTVPT